MRLIAMTFAPPEYTLQNHHAADAVFSHNSKAAAEFQLRVRRCTGNGEVTGERRSGLGTVAAMKSPRSARMDVSIFVLCGQTCYCPGGM